MVKQVIWIGAAFMNYPYDAKLRATHALDCTWALSVEAKQMRNSLHPQPWPRIDVAKVPADVHRCGFCGGGR